MKKILTILMGNGLIATFSVVACFLAVTSTNAAPLISARITQIIQDVKLLPSNAAPRPAVVNDDVHQGTAVRTGQDSRTELTFTDKTLTRLGANSVFSFDSGAGIFSLGQGSILMQVPPNGSSVKIKTAAVTAAITGGTAIFGTGPPVKFMVLEGTGTFYPNGHPDETMTLHGGEMVTFTPEGHMIGPTTFNVKLVLETSELIVPFDELENLPLIYDVISQQQGNGPQIAFNNQTQTFDETDQAQNALPTPAPSGTPGKFGAPSTISSPNPYVITSGTQIQTDPSITTNGVTDLGKIYRGPATDGPFSAYAFGSTSSFDTTSGFDSQINSSGAVFKFQSLQLTGDPTVNTTTGETSLALIGVDGITSAGPGGTLTFAGIQGLLFATQNGAINLGSEISFSGTGDLNFYARGAGSGLTLASAISGFTNLRLYSEGTTQINGDESATNFSAVSGGDVNIDGATLTSETLNISGAGDVNIAQGKSLVTLNAISISLSAQHDLNWSGQTSVETATNSNGNVTISAGNAINILSDLDIERTNGGRTSGLNITLNAGTALTVGGNLSLSTDASNIQDGGNIMVTSGGNTTIGGSFVLRTFGLTGTATGTGGNITVNTGGDLLAGNLDFTVDYNTTDVSVNNGANLTLNVGGDLTTTQGDVDMIIYTPIANSLTNGGNLSLSVGGDLNTAKGGNLNLTVVNTISTTVPNGANLFASIGGNLNANAVNVQIENDLSGGIGTGGNLTFNVSGDLNASSLLVQLSNSAGGHIANGGDITFHVGGDLTVAGDANFLLLNGGGTIGGNVAVTLGAVNVSANSLTAEIDNSNGGIGSSATINSNISGNVNVTNDLTLEILGGSETTPAEAININGGTYDIGGTFLASIDGDGTITLNNANIRADTIKITAFGANGTLNIGGGTISADTMLKLYAAGSNGSINFVANVTLNSQSTATLIQAVSVTIVNGVIVTIAGPAPAEVFTDHPNYSSTDTSGNPTGGNDSTTGKFAGSGAHTSPFSGPTPTPSGTPSKFGPPTTIASPVPYVITNNTVIQTDPAITTNGVTDYGKIWRGAATDGPLSAFIFGSTSSFDTSSAFDILLGGGGEGGAGFKFTALQLTGDPTVSTTNGEINLGLIAVNGITSGSPGGVLTFAGIRGLLLATQNGPITLGPEISFSGLHDINIYARGSSSDLTLGSDISTSNRIVLLAERDMSITSSLATTELVYAFAGRNIALLDPAIMHAETIMLSAGQDLTWNGQISDVTVLNSVGNVDISAGNQISIINALEIDRRFGGGQSSGLIVSLQAGTDLTAGNGLTVLIDNSAEGNMDSGAYARLAIGGNVTINGAGGLSLTIDNSSGGHIGTGGNIDVTTGGDFLATSGGMPFTIQNTSGTIDNGANITLMVGGSLSSAQALNLFVQNYDFSANAAGHIGNGGNIFVTTGGALTANSIDALINNRSGGTIGSGGSMIFQIAGSLSTVGNAGFAISNRYDDTVNGSTVGSAIGSDVLLEIQAGSVNIGGSLLNDTFGDTDSFSGISNRGGTIGGNATYSWAVSGDMTIVGDADMSILNDDGPNTGSNNPIGGTIHGAATLALNASSLSANSLTFEILNQNAGVSGPGGTIDSSATVIFNLSGNLTTQTDATFEIRNQYTGTGPGGIGGSGGTIGQDAILIVNANSLSIGGVLDTSIRNARNAGDNGGNIGGNAVIILGVAGSIGAVSDSQFLNNQGGTIGSNANITLSAGSLSTTGTAAGAFLVQLVNSGGRIGESASILFNVSGAITSQSATTFQIANFDADDGNGGGMIGGDAIISVNAGSISTGGVLGTSIDNFGGSAGGNAIIGFAATGNITAQGDATFVINNSNGGNGGGAIGSDATINLSAANISTGGAVFASIYNYSSGSIGGSANIDFGLSGDINAAGTGNAEFFIDNSRGGTIGSDATVNVSAANISAGGAVFASIYNYSGGNIVGSANINFAVSGDINAAGTGNAEFFIDNSNVGTIGADATVNVNAANISTGGALYAAIDNTGGTIGGNATINMNVSGTATVSSDATVQILGSAPTGSAAINFNGGSYEVAGTFLSSIDGDGTITFSNANVHADVIKAEVFGTNGMLKIGGGSLSADSTLKLYAAGSSGSIVFTADVTLTSGTAAIIAANTVTINNGVTVTIGGSIAANVYANTRNYDAASGGNGSALYGSFAGAGATSQPFPPPGGIISATTVTGTSATNTTPVSKSSVTTTATSSLPTNTTSKSSGLAVVSAAQTSKALLSTKRFVATQNLVSSHPVATSPATSKTTINLANSAELLSLVETGSESGNKINVSKPQSRNRVPQTGAANSTTATARRGNQAAETKLETNSPSAETTTLPIHPVSSLATTNVARSASY